MWHYIVATNVRRLVPAWGVGASQEYAVIVFVEDGHILAAIDERVQPHAEWVARADWGDGLAVPITDRWRSVAFGLLTPMRAHLKGGNQAR